MFNKILFTMLGLLISLNLRAGNESHNTHNAHHSNHHSDSKEISIKPLKKHVADEELKKRMSLILETMKELHEKSSKENRTKSLKLAGAKIETTVQDIFKSCKLAPEADAAIHPILADMLEGASLFKKAKEDEGHNKIHQALLQYEEYFEHSGWKHSSDE